MTEKHWARRNILQNLASGSITLDAIRGVGSLMVVVQHSLELWVPGFLRWSLDYINF